MSSNLLSAEDFKNTYSQNIYLKKHKKISGINKNVDSMTVTYAE